MKQETGDQRCCDTKPTSLRIYLQRSLVSWSNHDKMKVKNVVFGNCVFLILDLRLVTASSWIQSKNMSANVWWTSATKTYTSSGLNSCLQNVNIHTPTRTTIRKVVQKVVLQSRLCHNEAMSQDLPERNPSKYSYSLSWWTGSGIVNPDTSKSIAKMPD